MYQINTWDTLNLPDVICTLYLNFKKRETPIYRNKKGRGNCGSWRPCVINVRWDSPAPQWTGFPTAGDKKGENGWRRTMCSGSRCNLRCALSAADTQMLCGFTGVCALWCSTVRALGKADRQELGPTEALSDSLSKARPVFIFWAWNSHTNRAARSGPLDILAALRALNSLTTKGLSLTWGSVLPPNSLPAVAPVPLRPILNSTE